MSKKIIVIISALAVYTVAIILCFALIPNSGKSSNNSGLQSYTYIEYSEIEKAAIYSGLGLNTKKLAAKGFSVYQETFMTPFDWRKELHVIELHFENIYCVVKILCHADEIAWERESQNFTYTPIEIIGLSFEYDNSGIIRLDDTAKGVIYIFDCSENFNSRIYQEFLRVFFNIEG